MHPEIVRSEPGACPKCGMALVLKKENSAIKAAEYRTDTGLSALTWKSYIPLIVILGIILLTAVVLSFRDYGIGILSLDKTISYFMIGFFLVFGMFKLMDLQGFKEGYSTYDILAMQVPAYGYFYPFIELFFAFGMILMPLSKGLLVAEFGVMAFSGLGVAIKILKREPFMCACLGTFLKIPLTKVTLIEDFGMALLALVMLLYKF